MSVPSEGDLQGESGSVLLLDVETCGCSHARADAAAVILHDSQIERGRICSCVPLNVQRLIDRWCGIRVQGDSGSQLIMMASATGTPLSPDSRRKGRRLFPPA